MATMGSYVLYLLMQAFGALCFAYFSGTIAMRERRLPVVLVCVGFYLIMGATLVEVWGERGGWTTGGVGLYAALVSTGVALFGAGALLREGEATEDGGSVERLGLLLAGVALLTGLTLTIGGAFHAAVVDPDKAVGLGMAGGFSGLGPVGWILGTPLFIGAAILMVMGIGPLLTERDIRGLWLIGAGALFMLWPFDPQMAELPLGPSLMVLALTMTFFGLQPPKEDEAKTTKVPSDGEDLEEAGPFQQALEIQEEGVDPDTGEQGPSDVQDEGSEEEGEEGPVPPSDT